MNFFTKNPNLKTKEKKYTFLFSVFEVGGLNEFFLQRIQIYTIFFLRGWGGGGNGSGSVARG